MHKTLFRGEEGIRVDIHETEPTQDFNPEFARQDVFPQQVMTLVSALEYFFMRAVCQLVALTLYADGVCSLLSKMPRMRSDIGALLSYRRCATPSTLATFRQRYIGVNGNIYVRQTIGICEVKCYVR